MRRLPCITPYNYERRWLRRKINVHIFVKHFTCCKTIESSFYHFNFLFSIGCCVTIRVVVQCTLHRVHCSQCPVWPSDVIFTDSRAHRHTHTRVLASCETFPLWLVSLQLTARRRRHRRRCRSCRRIFHVTKFCRKKSPAHRNALGSTICKCVPRSQPTMKWKWHFDVVVLVRVAAAAAGKECRVNCDWIELRWSC